MIGWLVVLFGMGYFAAFYFEIVNTTMSQCENAPEWPPFMNLFDDIFFPFVKLLTLGTLSFGPYIALIFSMGYRDVWFLWAHWACVAYGCIYFPMAVVATYAFGSVGAALPHVVWPAIVRTFPLYLLAVIALVLAFFVTSHGAVYVLIVPYIGLPLSVAVFLYAMMFQGRLVGLIYLDRRDVLGWD